MKKNRFDNRCFSLAEAVISVAVVIFILVAFLVIYSNYNKFFNLQQNEIALGNSGREAVKELQNAALQADKILASQTVSGTTYTTGAHTVVLEIPSIDGSGNIVSGKDDYAVFYLTGKSFYRRIQADAASSRHSGSNKISDSVSALTLTYDNANLAQAKKIDADVQMQMTMNKQTASYHLRQEIYLRNK
ncbi:MAG: hypothetical protein NT170_02970 [Candidatus Moranbacteria bacterium]|nr:hypothetical protein [Candidatus Moranbacteria bacterium]